MPLRLRLKIDAACCAHRRYNPEKDGRPAHRDCPGCESLYCIWLYALIARRKAEEGEGLARQIGPRTQEPSTDASQAGAAQNATAPPDGADEQEAS
jgi:hypothetical protein